jgi:hypothetical protein
VPWNPDIYFSPYKWLHYDGGLIMGIGIHVIDSAHHWLELKKPRAAVAGGGTYYYKDGRDTPDAVSFILDYPDVTVTFEDQTGWTGLPGSAWLAGLSRRLARSGVASRAWRPAIPAGRARCRRHCRFGVVDPDDDAGISIGAVTAILAVLPRHDVRLTIDDYDLPGQAVRTALARFAIRASRYYVTWSIDYPGEQRDAALPVQRVLKCDRA